MKRNKKGRIGIIFGIFIIAFLSITFAYWIIFEYPSIEKECSENYSKYSNCVDKFNMETNLESIKICENLNMTWIKNEKHIFSSDVTVCVNNIGDIVRI